MIFVIFYVLGVVILSWVLSFLARQQHRVRVGAAPQAAADAVWASFSGVGWKQVDGRGMLNFKARGLGSAPTAHNSRLSRWPSRINELKPPAVDIWTSSWNSKMGIMGALRRGRG
jgi:hypothetical protein